MFVRWQKRHAKRWDLITAALIESARVDGQPRQRHVAYLGSVRINRAIRFWQRVDACLDKLDVTATDRHKIEAMLAAEVPRPSAAQQEAAERDRAEKRASMAQPFAGWPANRR